MLTRAAEVASAMARAHDDDLRIAILLELNHRILPAGEVLVSIGGDLDIATAEMAIRYVRKIIDRHRGPVGVDLAALGFCDARGLSAMVRMANYAERAGHPFRLVSPGPPLLKIMRITGLDRRLLAPQAARQIPEGHGTLA